MAKTNEKCVKCGGNSWIEKRSGFHIVYTCKRCGYVFDWLDYITSEKVAINTIATKRIITGQMKLN